MRAIHINWTKPFFCKKGDVPYKIDDFDALTTILSALTWRHFNGDVKLYTDRAGYDFYASLGLLNLWNGGIDVDVLQRIPDNINPKIFWAAAKIFALRAEQSPVVMLDTDLMVWKSLAEELKGVRVAAFHSEPLETDCYIPFELLKKRPGYMPDPDWDWTVLPSNTALAYFGDEEFKRSYTDAAINFMTDNQEMPMEMVSQMVFAEQRMLSMCAKKQGIPIHLFLELMYNGETNDFTHIWGAKDIARKDEDFHKELITSIMEAIQREFPSYRFPQEFLDYYHL
ncbi:MAG: hypothetical protein J5875_05035 [Paludibacteraceae bacterium]|nr:hypothetical protein [Paludibacteraceae bacterium]